MPQALGDEFLPSFEVQAGTGSLFQDRSILRTDTARWVRRTNWGEVRWTPFWPEAARRGMSVKARVDHAPGQGMSGSLCSDPFAGGLLNCLGTRRHFVAFSYGLEWDAMQWIQPRFSWIRFSLGGGATSLSPRKPYRTYRPYGSVDMDMSVSSLFSFSSGLRLIPLQPNGEWSYAFDFARLSYLF